jgi:hypothetical protein
MRGSERRVRILYAPGDPGEQLVELRVMDEFTAGVVAGFDAIVSERGLEHGRGSDHAGAQDGWEGDCGDAPLTEDAMPQRRPMHLALSSLLFNRRIGRNCRLSPPIPPGVDHSRMDHWTKCVADHGSFIRDVTIPGKSKIVPPGQGVLLSRP